MGSVDIGIDLGTANVLITLGKKGIVINEPSMVAYNTRKKRVIAVGDEAYKMVGRTPVNIIVVRPMKDGVISDNVMTEVMIKEYIGRLSDNMLVRPRVIICVPSAVTGYSGWDT
ncbi:MAG: rod shape-determining protein, partial [Oscillospiraceae bacterium]|nr:rod shape-determining protein [Oscillospiraceae bacterium]